ncbi:HD domain-containing protein [Filimonas lacunae]|uniref:HD domain-containing protein n=1 Tax=Filimonas lacunae TaxID=477680 RepID=A0A173MDA1_9BACT|nr:HD domain-containing protein [Filimonas lacunae]BAV05497.1 metal-dependent phosphohydrolase, HD subdomain [Filimonas lacunae]SIT20718.1 HD domain-containing protein [Filimonas lacunae]
MTRKDLNDISIYIGSLFMMNTPPFLVYHNIQHTEEVVKYVTEIADHYQLNTEDRFIVLAAAWFHDIGHLFILEGHEQKSVEVMRQYFAETEERVETIQAIAGCIMATRMPTNPQNFQESILCDADIYHLGTDQFFISDKKVKKEMELRTCKKFTDWTQHSIQFLRAQRYFTGYCRQLLEKGIENNIEILKNMLN